MLLGLPRSERFCQGQIVVAVRSAGWNIPRQSPFFGLYHARIGYNISVTCSTEPTKQVTETGHCVQGYTYALQGTGKPVVCL